MDRVCSLKHHDVSFAVIRRVWQEDCVCDVRKIRFLDACAVAPFL